MTRAASIPSLLKRVINVTIVALCTASSLALLGAVPAKWAMARRSANQSAAKHVALAPAAAVAEEVGLAQLASYTIRPEVEVAPAVAAAPATRTRVMRMEVTAYCPCTKCCGPNAHGVTASGKPVTYNDSKFVAADTSVLPFGKKLVVPGYAGNAAVEVVDRGGAIKGNKLDLYFPTHDEALVWGRQHLNVTVIE